MSEFGIAPNLIGSGIEKYMQSMPDKQDVESLKADGKKLQQRMESVGKEFEGVFLSLMLKEMRNTLEDGGFFGGDSSDTYGGMFDMFIGQHLAESSPLGIAELMLSDYQKNQQTSEANNPENEASDEKQEATNVSVSVVI